MYRSVVVALDGSTQSEHALALAQQLLVPGDGRLTLVGVVSDIAGGWGGGGIDGGATPYAAMMRDRVHTMLQRAVAELDAGTRHRTAVVSDISIAGAIDDAAQTQEADLIVLGGSYRPFDARPVALAVLADARCAVAVAGAGTGKPSGRICVAFDGTAEACLALEAGYELAGMLGCDVDICCVVGAEGEDAARSELLRALDLGPPSLAVDGRVLHGPVVAALLEAARGAALLVCGSSPDGPPERVTSGTVSRGLLSGGQVPVLVTPRGAARDAGGHRMLGAAA